jgi:hypothetical protein
MHCNILNLLGLNFDFCDFCAFLRLYQLRYTKVFGPGKRLGFLIYFNVFNVPLIKNGINRIIL